MDKIREIMNGMDLLDIYDEIHGLGCPVIVTTEWGWYESPSVNLLAEHYGIDAKSINHKLKTVGKWESPGIKIVLSKQFCNGSFRDMLPVGFEYRSPDFI